MRLKPIYRRVTKPHESNDEPSVTHPKLCEECGLSPAQSLCADCEQFLCFSCDNKIHGKAARRNHNRSSVIKDEEYKDSSLTRGYRKKFHSNASPFGNNNLHSFPNNPSNFISRIIFIKY